MLDISVWQVFWFFVIGAALTVFIWLDGFDLGIGMRLPFLKQKDHRMTALNVIWPVWDGNELYGLIGGGAIFATFPVVFTGLLGGLYPWLVLLLVFVMLRPITFEAWLHEPEKKRIWEITFMLSSIVIPFVVGVAAGGTIAGLPFDQTMTWAVGHSFLEALSPFSIACGVTLVFVCLMHGSSYLIKKTEGAIADEAKSQMPLHVLLAGGSILLTLVIGLIQNVVRWEKPLAIGGLILAVLVIGAGLVFTLLNTKKNSQKGPFWSSSMVILGIWIAVASLQFPVIVHSSISPAYDLGIFTPGVSNPQNSMEFIGIVATIALAITLVYTIFVYRIFKGKVNHKTNAHY